MSTSSCRKKWTSAAPTEASGRISRGNHTFFTRPEPATTDPVPEFRAAVKKFQTSRPDRR